MADIMQLVAQMDASPCMTSVHLWRSKFVQLLMASCGLSRASAIQIGWISWMANWALKR